MFFGKILSSGQNFPIEERTEDKIEQLVISNAALHPSSKVQLFIMKGSVTLFIKK